MKIIQEKQASSSAVTAERVAEVLRAGGLVCLPCGGRYRVVADLTNTDAVLRLMQSKGRVHNAPALVFVDREEALQSVTAAVDPLALSLARHLWPEPLTVRVKPSATLPKAVLKQLGGRKTRVGVRVPAEPLLRTTAALVGRPLLVSSANRERKAGDSSPAQVRRTFANQIDLFVDQGDLTPEQVSTVIDVKKGKIVIERAGAISAGTLEQLTAA